MKKERNNKTETGTAKIKPDLRKKIFRWIVMAVVVLVVPGGMLILLGGGLRQTLSHFNSRSNDRSITRSTV